MLHMVAKLHYESEMSQIDIARKLSVSTATVSRMLQKARSVGIVRIEVLDLVSPEEITADLIAALGLKTAAVIDTPQTGVLGALAQPLGAILKTAGLGDGAVIGIGWGRAVREVVLAGLPALGRASIVPLTGGMQQAAAHFQINEFVRLAAEQIGGAPHFLHVPYLSSPELREAVLADPSVSETVALWNRLDCAIVGIGLTHAPQPSETSAATAGEKALVEAAGDVIRHYVSEDGRLLDWEGEARMIAASAAQLRTAPLSIGVAAGAEKAEAMIGAVRAGMVNALVTDTVSAQAILGRLAASRDGDHA